MDTPNKSEKPCPGPTKSSRSRVESLREKRERLRDEMRKASAQLAEAEKKEEKLARIEARQRERQEQEQLGALCKQVGLDRFRLSRDASNTESPSPLDAQLIGGALSWLLKQISLMSQEDMDVFREKGATMVNQEMQEKKDARVKKDAHMQESQKGVIDHPSAFEIRE